MGAGNLNEFLSLRLNCANLTANFKRMRSTHFLTYIVSSTSAFFAAMRANITTPASSSNLLPISMI